MPPRRPPRDTPAPTWRDTVRVFVGPVLAVVAGITAGSVLDLPWWQTLIVALVVLVAVEVLLDSRVRGRAAQRTRD